MRKPEREITDKALVESLLLRARYVTLALWDGQAPHIVPVNFGYEAGRLYFHTAAQGRKTACLRACDRVAFSAVLESEIVRGEKPCDFSCNYTSVIGHGRGVVLEDEAEKRRALAVIMRHYGGPEASFRPEALRVTGVVRVDVEALTGKSRPAPKS